MPVTIVRGDARHLPLPDSSVDLIVTSPPYWSLRDYRDGDQSLAGQIGAESTPHEYLEALWECTREWMRVLKPSGSLFVVLGDKYATRWSSRSEGAGLHHDRGRDARGGRNTTGVPGKSLIGLPWRYALGCVDQLELILRAEIIWDKPSALPESVTDRVRRSHEQIFHFTSRPRYYAAVDQIRKPHVKPWVAGRNGGTRPKLAGASAQYDGLDGSAPHALGALPGSVWEIATQPLNVPDRIAHARCCDGMARDGCTRGIDHYAAFPFEIPRRIIRGWSPTAICTACGEGRRPSVAAVRTLDGEPGVSGSWKRGGAQIETSGVGNWRFATDRRHLGFTCACPTPDASSMPALVVDPFGGTGTTALIADLYGRHGITVDRSADYCRIAQWRTTDPGERARGLEQPKPKLERTEREDQGGLWEDEVSA